MFASLENLREDTNERKQKKKSKKKKKVKKNIFLINFNYI